jgi:hypothetical protein
LLATKSCKRPRDSLKEQKMRISAHRPTLISALTFAVLLTPLAASAALSTPSGIGVKFIAAGPAGVSIVGESAALRIIDDGQSIAVRAPLDALHTGIGLRDRHMKEKYLEVAKYPEAELRVDRKSLAFPSSGSQLAHDTRGELKLHGHTKPVSFHYVATRAANGFDVSATFHVNIKDYGIEVPSYLGVTVKPDVEVSVHFHVQGS